MTNQYITHTQLSDGFAVVLNVIELATGWMEAWAGDWLQAIDGSGEFRGGAQIMLIRQFINPAKFLGNSLSGIIPPDLLGC